MAGIWARLKKRFAWSTRTTRRKLSGDSRKAVSDRVVNASTSGPEITVLRCAALPSDGRTRLVEYTERCGVAEARVSEFEFVAVENLCGGSEVVRASEYSCVENSESESGILSEVRDLPGNDLGMEMAGSAATLRVGLPGKSRGSSLSKTRRPGWRPSSNSAFVVLVALSAFLWSRFGHVQSSVAAVMTINGAMRLLHKWKLSARLVFSSVALYFLNSLRSYLTHCPRRLSSQVLTDTQPSPSADEAPRKPVMELPQGVRSSEVSVLPLESAPSANTERGTPSLLVTIPESITSTESAPAAAIRKKSGASGTSRRLAKKLASKLKKLKMFRSSSSASPSVSVSSVSERSLSPPHPGTHCNLPSAPARPISPSSHDKHRKCPFQKTKSSTSSDLSEPPHATGEVLSEIDKTATENAEHHHGGEMAASTEDASTAPRTVSWPAVGLLVTLLFLLVGRIPAIMATSIFFLVVSNTHHDRGYSRVSRNDKQALEAARKLYRNPAPHRSRHPGSPPRTN